MSNIQSYNLTANVSRCLSPQLKKRSKTIYTETRSTNQANFKTGLSVELSEKQQYVKLTMKSLRNNFPVSQLKPYSTFYSVQKIQQDMKNEQIVFRKTNFKKRHTMYDNTIFRQKSKKDSKNTTFYQTKKNNNQKLKQNLKYVIDLITSKRDDQQSMVKQYIKQNKNISSVHKHIFQTVNQKIKQQFPHHFEPKDCHNESKCRSKSCNQGFFKRKKYKVSQKYDLDQPGYNKFQILKQKINKIRNGNNQSQINKNKQSNSFCIFSKSKNRIMRTQKIIMNQNSTEQSEMPKRFNFQQMNLQTRDKFLRQSNAYYKRYMRNSFYQKKKTLIQEMKIKIQ